MSKKSSILGKAHAFFKQNKWGKAIQEYEKIIQMAPNDLTTLNILGDLYIKNGKQAKALEVFDTIAKSYIKDGVLVKATAVYKKVIRIAPEDSFLAYKELANLYLQQGLIGEAVENLYITLRYYKKNERYKDSIDAINAILDVRPDILSLRKELAEIYAKLGRNDESEKEFLLVVSALVKVSKYAEAESILRGILEKKEDSPEALCLLSKVLYKSGRFDDSVAVVQKVLEHEPSNTEALITFSELLIENGDYGKVGEYLEALLEISPEDRQGRLLYARMCMHKGNIDAARREYFRLAEIFFNAHEKDKCVDTMQEFLREKPENVLAHEKLADFYTKFGDSEEVSAEYRKIAEIYADSNELEKAVNILKKLVQTDPSDINSRTLLNKYSEESFSGDAPETIEKLGTEQTGEIELEKIELEDSAVVLDTDTASDNIDLSNIDLESAADPYSETASDDSVELDFGDLDLDIEDSTEEQAEAPLDEVSEATPDCSIELDFGDLDLDIEDSTEEQAEAPLDDVSETGDVPTFRDHVPNDDDLEKSKFSVKDDTEGELSGEELVDIGNELREEIKQEEKLPSYGVDDIFKEFKKGVAENIAEEDFSTHYNLGIAYKEMGLWADAMHEFAISTTSPEFCMESYEMIGECALLDNKPDKAVELLNHALKSPLFEADKGIAIMYFLGCAYEKLSEYEKARESFQKVYIMRSDFKDVRDRIKSLNNKNLAVRTNPESEDKLNVEEDLDLFDPSTLLDD